MIYFVLSIILLFCFWIDYNSKFNSTASKVVFRLSSLLFLSLFALRGVNVGGDMIEYVRFFTGKGSQLYGNFRENELESGFVIISKFLETINDSGFFFIFSTSLISLIPFIILVNKYSRYRVLSLLYVISANFAIMIVNIETNIRQNLASAFFLIALLIFWDRNKIKNWYWISVPLIILSLFTHSSMYLLLPLSVGMYYLTFNKKASIIIIVLSFFLPLIDVSFINNLFYSSGDRLSQLELLNNISRYMDSSSHYELTEGTVKYTLMAPPTIWAIFNVWSSSKSELNSFFMKSLIVGMVLINFGVSFPLSFRSAYLFILIGYCYIPVKLRSDKTAMIINMLVVVVLIYRLYTYVVDPSNYNSDNHALPYEFIF